MAFGTATVVTNKGKAMFADRLRGTPGTYTNPPKYVSIGTGATGAARTAAVTDTALTTEVETRVAGTESTVTTSVTGDTYQLAATITMTADRAIDESGAHDAITAGNMAFSATFAVMNIPNGNSLSETWKVQQS